MLILRGMPCSAALRRGLLWHSWLKNQILNMDAGFVVRMYSHPALREARESFERKIQPGGEFEAKLHDARQFVQDIIGGYSPAQLVDIGVLSSLSAEVRASIKATIHQEYLAQTGIEQHTELIANAIDNLEQALKEFADAWYRQPVLEESLLKSRFEQSQARARTLHNELEKLPEGIVLP